jgi:protein involved in polysaccharide export with SLBB domain
MMKLKWSIALMLTASLFCSAQENDERSLSPTRGRVLTTPELRNATTSSTQEPKADGRNDLEDHLSAEPENEFQRFVSKSLGQSLPLFGADLFRRTPLSTFAPVDRVPVTNDYVIGPGDELLIRAWGQVDIDLRLRVDRSGLIHLPKAGDLNVSGIRFDQLPAFLRTAIERVYRNFDLTVTLGELRSIQVFVLGNARRPGAYTVSSLSTLVNALFASGGPSPAGSMRRIALLRGSRQIVEFDLYDLLARGDKSHDVSLQPGDVIYVPASGPIVAISGSVQTPAIFEMKAGEDFATVLGFAGGTTPVASSGRVIIERISEGKFRSVLESKIDDTGLHQLMTNGDVVRIEPISPKFEQSVTLRGNVAEPGRYPYRQGMKVRDLLPDSQLLLTREFWDNQNDLARAHSSRRVGTKELKTEVQRSGSDINWEYALVERIQPDLSTELFPFNLGRVLADPNSSDNLELRSSDIVTVFSQSEIAVPASRQSRYVRLEGEINAAGVYRVSPGETLRQLLRRAGGTTKQAFLFAAQFTRESVRIEQTERYRKYLDDLEAQINRAATATSQSREEAEQRGAELERQRRLVSQMRDIKPTGRVVLGIGPEANSSDALPEIELEDGDRLYIPTQPSTVSVMGAVYNESAFFLTSGKQLSWYLERAGGSTREADESRAFVLRADGSIVSKTMSNASWKSKFKDVLPGDSIVVPLRLDRSSFMHNLKDWSQILSQFALGTAAIRVLGQ